VSIYNGFDPVITFDNATGRIVILDTMEVSLTKQLVATKLLRVYYSALTSNTICISNVNSSVNADYEETMTGIFNGCVTVTGINILYQSGMIKVMPNPSTDIFTVSSDMLNGANAVVTVTDAMGRVVLSRREVIAGGKGFGIDLQNYPKGVYLLRISTDQMDLTEKLLKL
jgi:hypothetical protein